MRPGHPDSVWAFLKRLLEGLLIREQTKLSDKLDDGLRGRLATHLTEQALYGPEEQIVRMLGKHLPVSYEMMDLPTSTRAEYEEAVAGILLEHPFVGHGDLGFGSVVFRDYVLAWALANGDQHAADAARQHSRDARFRTSPLIGRFTCEMLAVDDEVIADPRDLAVVYDSLCSEDSADRYTTMALHDTSVRIFADIAVAAGGQVHLVTELPEGQYIQLDGRLAHAAVFLGHHGIELGRIGEQLHLGPGLLIDAPGLRISASDVRVASREDDGVTLLTDQFAASAPDARVVCSGRQPLVIGTNQSLAFPWASYRVPIAVVPSDDRALYEQLRELGKLMAWFKGDVKGNLSHPTKTMDALVAKKRVGPELFALALERGLLVRAGKDYVLRPDEFGINFAQVRQRQANDDVREFLAPLISRPTTV